MRYTLGPDWRRGRCKVHIYSWFQICRTRRSPWCCVWHHNPTVIRIWCSLGLLVRCLKPWLIQGGITRYLKNVLWNEISLHFIRQHSILVKSLGFKSIACSNPIAATHWLCDWANCLPSLSLFCFFNPWNAGNGNIYFIKTLGTLNIMCEVLGTVPNTK